MSCIHDTHSRMRGARTDFLLLPVEGRSEPGHFYNCSQNGSGVRETKEGNGPGPPISVLWRWMPPDGDKKLILCKPRRKLRRCPMLFLSCAY